MATVQMPDGTVVDMPDQLDPALGARLRAFQQNYKPPPPPAPPPTTAGDVVKGVGDAALSGASKVATGIVGAPIALANRLIAALSGGDGQLAADAAHEYVNRTFGHDTQTPVGKHIGAAVAGALAPLGESAEADKQLLEQGGQKLGLPPGTVSNQLSEAGDIAGTAGLAAPIAEGAQASAQAAKLAAASTPAAVTRYGFRTLADHPIAAGVAGPSGTQTVSLHNQALGNTVLGAEAGIDHGVPITYAHLEGARNAPNAVYGRVAASLPEAPLSPAAQAQVAQAGTGDLVTHSPDAQAILDAQKQRLLAGPLNGDAVINNIRALRQEGGTRLASEDVEQQNLGRAQLDLARGLEQHVADTLQTNAPVTLAQFQAARTALAKNYAVQSALKGNNVDMQAIARRQRNDPGLMTGPMADVAEFANQHPAVSGLTNRIEVPPSYANDLGKVLGAAGQSGHDLGSRLSNLFGLQKAARTVLAPSSSMDLAQQVPVVGRNGEFAPVAPRQPAPLDLTPPPGQAFTPHQPELAPAANPQRDFFGYGTGGMTASPPSAPSPAGGGQGGISLADLLSHGVEQQPAPGLSLAPMGIPQQEGIPFQRNAGHEAGGLSLLDDLIGPAAQSVPNQDNAHVMSQGVPEGIMTRTPKKMKLKPGDVVKGPDLGDLL